MTWLPFELHSETPPETIALTDYFKNFGPDQIKQMHAGLKARADELGLPLNPPMHLSNTRKALALAEYARDLGKLEDLHMPLFQAYFVKGQNLYDDAVLREVAEAAGIDADAALAAVAEGRYEERLDEYARQARSYGITGVPTWIINNKYKVVGAQPFERLREVFLQISQQG